MLMSSETFMALPCVEEFKLEAPAARNVSPCHMQQRTFPFSDVPWKWW